MPKIKSSPDLYISTSVVVGGCHLCSGPADILEVVEQTMPPNTKMAVFDAGALWVL